MPRVAACRSCGDPIETYTGHHPGAVYWRHQDRPDGMRPLHPAIPVQDAEAAAEPQRAEVTQPLEQKPTAIPTDELIAHQQKILSSQADELVRLSQELMSLRLSHEAYVGAVQQVFQTRFAALGHLQQILANKGLTDKMARDLALTSLSSLTPLSPLAP